MSPKPMRKRISILDIRYPGPSRDMVPPRPEKEERISFPTFSLWPQNTVISAIPTNKIRSPYRSFRRIEE